MKYSGVINIVDDLGEMKFERELTADEIIEVLLESPRQFVEDETEKEPEEEDVPVRVPAPKAKAVVPPPTGKRSVTCKGCGKVGHQQKTCPDLKRIQGDPDFSPKPEPAAPAEDGPVYEGSPALEMNAPRDGEMSGISFLKVKDLQREGKPSVVIASAVRRTLKEVNFAMQCETHGEYMKKRKQ